MTQANIMEIKKSERQDKLKEYKQIVSDLIRDYTDIDKGAGKVLQTLYRIQDKLKEIEWLENMPDYILKAFLQYKQAVYSNYQTEHLKINTFDRDQYLDRIIDEAKAVDNNRRGDAIMTIRDFAEDEVISISELNHTIIALLAIKKQRLEKWSKEQEPYTKSEVLDNLEKEQDAQEKADEFLRKHNWNRGQLKKIEAVEEAKEKISNDPRQELYAMLMLWGAMDKGASEMIIDERNYHAKKLLQYLRKEADKAVGDLKRLWTIMRDLDIETDLDQPMFYFKPNPQENDNEK